MPEQIYIGNFGKGLITSRLPFVIDNDAFPTMFNFYSWRGRAKRKRGTFLLGQLQIQEQIAAVPNNYQLTQFALVAGTGNLISHYSLGSSATLVPGSLSLVVGANTYTDTNLDGTLQGTPAGSGSVNYATGAFTISGGGVSNVTGTFSYFPGKPVMGLRDLVATYIVSNPLYPLLLAFDTTKAYQLNQNSATVFFYNVTYYKGTNTPFVWSGQDYQQFWTANYSNALWATNNKPGFNFVTGTYTAGTGTPTITMNLKTGGVNYTNLIIGDKLWFNEWTAGGSTINGLVGSVTTNADAANGNYIITFTGNQTVAGTGIAQLLTASITGQDGIKWYDGDPTGGTGIPTGTGFGWVNFAPPLTATTVSIENQPAALYYLVGALAILPFKDRLLFFSPYIQTSTGAPIQLQDTVLWSWNGTPYYNSLVPSPISGSETFDVRAYYVDQTGLGGWISAGISQPIMTVSNNEDALLIGFGGARGRKTRYVYTGNDINPFLFYNINSELPSDSTFSAISLDKGAIDIGVYGVAMTDQQSSQRVDLDIPDSVFQIQAQNNGAQRVSGVRDFQKEWIYFDYPVSNSPWKFPTQSFLFNYRDNTWAILYENFTAQGTYRKQQKYTWRTIPFSSWSTWQEAWNSGSTTPQYPSIVGGTPQGFVLVKGQGTGEGQSGTILAIANSGGLTQITSINHCVSAANPNTDTGDYLYFNGAISTTTATITGITVAAQAIVTAVNTFSAGQYVLISEVVGMTQINGKYVQIVSATGTNFTINLNTIGFTAYSSGGIATFSPLQAQIGKVISTADANTFVVDIPFTAAIYAGNGYFTRLSQPVLQTKQFNPYWEQGRQVRLSAQKYLLDFTPTSQITVNISLSQDPDDNWNSVVQNPPPNGLVYSQIVYTCPESTNIGLTPANTNLQMPTAEGQYQIWHRYNTSLIGDSFQIGFTLSDAQMRNLTFATAEVSLHGMHITIDKSSHLA